MLTWGCLFETFNAHTEHKNKKMRTKIALLSAALVAAGVASSMAQSNVYSLNVVGYVNINVTTGYNLITLPLLNADNTSAVNSVLTNTTPVVPGACTVSSWDPVHVKFNDALFAGGDGNWYDGSYSYLTNLPGGLPPGKGFFFYLPTPAQQVASGDPAPGITSLTLTVVGTVLQGTNTYPVTAGYDFYGNFEPVSGDLTTNGLPVVDASFITTWNGHAYNNASFGLGTNDSSYDSMGNIVGNPAPYPVFADGGYNVVQVVAPAVGQGFLYHYAGTATTWTQTFTVH
jgi:hypothetical protein